MSSLNSFPLSMSCRVRCRSPADPLPFRPPVSLRAQPVSSVPVWPDWPCRLVPATELKAHRKCVNLFNKCVHRAYSGSRCCSSHQCEQVTEAGDVSRRRSQDSMSKLQGCLYKLSSSGLALAFWLCAAAQPCAAYMDFSTSVITVVSGVHTVLMDQNAAAEREGSRQVGDARAELAFASVLGVRRFADM